MYSCYANEPVALTLFPQVVATLPTEPAWAGKRVNYGKDRCAYVPKNQHGGFGMNNGFAPFSPAATSFGMNSPATGTFGSFPQLGINSAVTGSGFESGTPTSPAFPMGIGMNMAQGTGGAGNRTVYLGNIHPETSMEDLCNAIRGGVLQSIRYMQDKHIAVSSNQARP